MVETDDGIRDGEGESVGVSKGAVGELMLLEVAPASFDVIQLGGVFGQPLDSEPGTLRPGISDRQGARGLSRPLLRPGAL